MLTKASSFALLFVVGLVAAASVAVPSNVPLLRQERDTTNSSHHLIVGARVPGDYLLSQQVVTKSGKWLTNVTKDVTVRTPNNQTITQVRALDQKTNGNGAYASITYGGPGNHNVTVHFKSQRGHGITFLLETYIRHW